ncbi:alpha/beta fold hydrolase [Lentibacillus sediminis]|uniref:alpha/beta fold hydrolase n=1 Tax=Lentibacillus sediminis TaxID=1940529 RepID=UPI000C1C386C|nr:alpha/beta hydrolase [Lentibacillus sediminis]
MILHTKVSGKGEPVVLIHQGLQTSETDFQAEKDYLQENYQVILPDLRGHGKSASDDFSDYFNDCARDLNDTLTELNIDSTHIAGSSLGALAALMFAKKYPHRVKSLVISGIIPKKPANWEEQLKEEKAMQANVLENKDAIAYFDQIHDGDWSKLLKIAVEADWYPFNETGDLTMLEVPVLFVVGEGNTNETIGAQIYPRANKNIHVAIIPFASHLVHLDQPEIYMKVVEDFLKRVEK